MLDERETSEVDFFSNIDSILIDRSLRYRLLRVNNG